MCEPTFLPVSAPDVAARRRLSFLLRQFARRRADLDDLFAWYKLAANSTDDLTVPKLFDKHLLFLDEAEDWRVDLNLKDFRLCRPLAQLAPPEQAPPLSKEERDVIARWVFFLRSGQRYRWPEWRGRALWCRNLRRLVTWLSFGLIRWKGMREEEYGDVDVWPFLNRAEYEAALQTPRLLCGKQAA